MVVPAATILALNQADGPPAVTAMVTDQAELPTLVTVTATGTDLAAAPGMRMVMATDREGTSPSSRAAMGSSRVKKIAMMAIPMKATAVLRPVKSKRGGFAPRRTLHVWIAGEIIPWLV